MAKIKINNIKVDNIYNPTRFVVEAGKANIELPVCAIKNLVKMITGAVNKKRTNLILQSIGLNGFSTTTLDEFLTNIK